MTFIRFICACQAAQSRLTDKKPVLQYGRARRAFLWILRIRRVHGPPAEYMFAPLRVDMS